MWILKTSKDLLKYIQSRSISSCNSIKTFDFSTLYTTIPHSKLQDRLKELVQQFFMKKNCQCRNKYLVLGRDRSYFVSNHSDSTKKLSETDIINMLEFLIDNIIVIFGGRVFQQTVEIKGFDCKSCNLLCFYLFVDDHINIFTSYLPCACLFICLVYDIDNIAGNLSKEHLLLFFSTCLYNHS
jgi:hypothetical protein